MNGVKIGDKHSISNWDLLLVKRSIETPSIKEKKVDIPARNGSIDLSDFFGEVKYNNRNITMEFDMFQKPQEWMNLKQQITNYIHGRVHKIIFDNDANYYYKGRCKISSFDNETTVGHITIEADCEPYKYKIAETVITKAITPNLLINCLNDRMTTIPTFTVTAQIKIKFNNVTYTVQAGTHKILDIVFKEGNNSITVVEGTGNITIKYQEGAL